MPAWMTLLHGSIASDATPLYARLFLVKAVLHVEARHTARMAAAQEPSEVRLSHIFSRCISNGIHSSVLKPVQTTQSHASSGLKSISPRAKRSQ